MTWEWTHSGTEGRACAPATDAACVDYTSETHCNISEGTFKEGVIPRGQRKQEEDTSKKISDAGKLMGAC